MTSLTRKCFVSASLLMTLLPFLSSFDQQSDSKAFSTPETPFRFDAPKLNYSLSSAGDVNGDGYTDVILGAYTSDYGIGVSGMAMVFLGSPSGVNSNPNWSATGEQGTSNYGISVAHAGDVNGDGFADVIVGANFHTGSKTNEGAAFLYMGSPTGLQKTPSWTAMGGQENAFFGTSVSGAGDVNKDGYADVVVGSPYFDNGETNEGRVFVYYGSPNGLGKEPAWTAESNQPSAFFGKSVAGAGDVNSDGYFDVAIGAPAYDNGQNNEGRVFLYMGSLFGLQQAPSWTGESNQVDAAYGTSVAYGGDINKDGFADVIIGSNRYDRDKSNQGRAYVYFGYSGGLSMYPDWTMDGDDIDANFGYSVSTAGDVNGDGFHDIVVGSYGYQNLESPLGKVSVYYGSAKGILPDKEYHTNRNNLTQIRIGASVAGCDVNGDGYGDVLSGVEWMVSTSGNTPKGKVVVINGNNKGIGMAQP